MMQTHSNQAARPSTRLPWLENTSAMGDSDNFSLSGLLDELEQELLGWLVWGLFELAGWFGGCSGVREMFLLILACFGGTFIASWLLLGA